MAEACRQRGLDRTSCHAWKRRFRTQGFEGLDDLPPIRENRPKTAPAAVVERISRPLDGRQCPRPMPAGLSSIQSAMPIIITFSVSETKPSGTLLSPPTQAHFSSRRSM